LIILTLFSCHISLNDLEWGGCIKVALFDESLAVPKTPIVPDMDNDNILPLSIHGEGAGGEVKE
jgi:hypothetical protein